VKCGRFVHHWAQCNGEYAVSVRPGAGLAGITQLNRSPRLIRNSS
jgi:hypothetical protein